MEPGLNFKHKYEMWSKKKETSWNDRYEYEVQYHFTSPALILRMICVTPGSTVAPRFAIRACTHSADDVVTSQVTHSTFFRWTDILQRNLAFFFLIVQDVDCLRAAAWQITRHRTNLPGSEEWIFLSLLSILSKIRAWITPSDFEINYTKTRSRIKQRMMYSFDR